MIEQEVMDLMKNLDALDEPSRMQLLSRVGAQRNELLEVLLKHLDTSSSEHVRAAAIYLIGRYRLERGVADLARRIDFAPGRGQRIPEPEPLWDRYPAMEALIAIGRPSVSPAIKLLASETNETRRDLALKVVRYVEDADVARFMLQRAQAAESDPIRKANLNEALSRLEKTLKEQRQ